jgi:putative toxin-antitoxin system antitoxin component (TIGR02293 family)
MAGRAGPGKRSRVYYSPSPKSRKRETISYAELIGLTTTSELALADKVESGFDYRAFIRLQQALKLTARQLADLLSIPDRTLSRRKSEGRLRPDESDRLLRLARVVDLALGLFEGDKKAAQSWLLLSNDALGGKTPIELSRTEVGAREVESLIHRLEHGVFV